jgi:glucose-6-phosphate-specific signal transduction histidine kinase
MKKLSINKRPLLRVLLGVYLFPLYLVVFSLSVPPADLPLCGLMFVLSVFGLVLARREIRAWRVVWTGALIASIILAVLQIIAGRNIAHQRSKHDSNMRLAMPEKSPEPTPVARRLRAGDGIV